MFCTAPDAVTDVATEPQRVKRYRTAAFVSLAATVAFCLLMSGCSKTASDSGHSRALPQSPNSDPVSRYPSLDVDRARDKARAASKAIYEMIDMPQAKATEPGPGISTCDEDPGHLYKTFHPWSVYDVSEGELKAGFQRLRKELPKKGWKIVDYGPNKSQAKTLSLTADSETDRFSVNAELMVSTPSNPHEKKPLILVNVVSGCWRAPKGTDLNTQY
ncbi:hypothetical protein ACQ4WX_22120 [Streptomyces lasalocidi]